MQTKQRVEAEREIMVAVPQGMEIRSPALPSENESRNRTVPNFGARGRTELNGISTAVEIPDLAPS